MPLVDHVTGKHLVLSPQEPLVAGGPAEEFERGVQALFRSGHSYLVADLRSVSLIDSAGVRALVRCHTTAQRMNATFALTGVNDKVGATLALSRLDSVFTIHRSLEAAQAKTLPWANIRLITIAATLCATLWWAGTQWPTALTGEPTSTAAPFGDTSAAPIARHPLIEVAKLLTAALIGLIVTATQRRLHRERPMSQGMEHAQILLCVSGAAIMMIIGNSLARAFGIAGAASIIRFRTPVEDPKDITVLFLLMALGMSSGLGLFAVAGLSTGFLCILLVLLDYVGAKKPRTMMVEITADGREFPVGHVQSVFARNRVIFEPRELSQGKESVFEYHTTLEPTLSLEDLSAELMAGDAGVKAVSWKPTKKSD